MIGVYWVFDNYNKEQVKAFFEDEFIIKVWPIIMSSIPYGTLFKKRIPYLNEKAIFVKFGKKIVKKGFILPVYWDIAFRAV